MYKTNTTGRRFSFLFVSHIPSLTLFHVFVTPCVAVPRIAKVVISREVRHDSPALHLERVFRQVCVKLRFRVVHNSPAQMPVAPSLTDTRKMISQPYAAEEVDCRHRYTGRSEQCRSPALFFSLIKPMASFSAVQYSSSEIRLPFPPPPINGHICNPHMIHRHAVHIPVADCRFLLHGT